MVCILDCLILRENDSYGNRNSDSCEIDCGSLFSLDWPNVLYGTIAKIPYGFSV